MKIRMIVLIGAKEQCDLYPSMLSLLADESGIIVHIVEIAEAIAPAINIISTNNLIIDLMAFFIFNYKLAN
jgi:hypothetical protein